MIAILRLLRR